VQSSPAHNDITHNYSKNDTENDKSQPQFHLALKNALPFNLLRACQGPPIDRMSKAPKNRVDNEVNWNHKAWQLSST
jgi:hypothetical protein